MLWIISRLTLIHVGKRGYDPVVRTSMANGMAKLGSRACTRASLARDASLSAVSTKRMVCWSRKLEIICYHGYGGERREYWCVNEYMMHTWQFEVYSSFPIMQNCCRKVKRHIPHTFQLSLHCLPTSLGRADVQKAVSYDWQIGQSQFSWKRSCCTNLKKQELLKVRDD